MIRALTFLAPLALYACIGGPDWPDLPRTLESNWAQTAGLQAPTASLGIGGGEPDHIIFSFWSDNDPISPDAATSANTSQLRAVAEALCATPGVDAEVAYIGRRFELKERPAEMAVLIRSENAPQGSPNRLVRTYEARFALTEDLACGQMQPRGGVITSEVGWVRFTQ